MVDIDRVVTHGTFELDGGSWEVDNNIWLVGDDSDVVVFDAAHAAAPIIAAVAGRNVVAVVCTHGHNDHVTVAPRTRRGARRTGAAAPRRRRAVADDPPGQGLSRHFRRRHLDRRRHRVAGAAHPGPLPRIGVLVRPRAWRCRVQRRHLVLRRPGRNRALYSDFPTILQSISERLGTLPGDTVVHTGHGDSTTVGDEIVHYEEWVARGH